MNLRPENLTNPQEAYRVIRGYLQESGVEDAGLDTQILIRHVTQGLWFSLDAIPQKQAVQLAKLAQRRANREPLHYLLGSCPFLDMNLMVGPGVLIPRPETEELCLYAAKLLEEVEYPKILDLCSGSGAIALGLQQQIPGADITAVEWQQGAYAYLERNILLYKKRHATAPVAKRADVLSAGKLFPPKFYDLIVCNPPYVTEAEYEKLEPELRYEPKEALVPGGEDPLVFYEVVCADFFKALKPGGFLVFEIGSGQGAGVRKIMRDNGYVKLWTAKDMAGHSRICKGQKPPQEKKAAPPPKKEPAKKPEAAKPAKKQPEAKPAAPAKKQAAAPEAKPVEPPAAPQAKAETPAPQPAAAPPTGK